MKITTFPRFIAMVFMLVVFAAVPAAAVTITESPSHLQRGDPVTITITGLNDGSRFSLSIEGVFSTTPGTETTFQTSNFNMPISLKSGTLSAATRGTEWTEVSVKKGTTTVNLMDAADSSGFFSMSQSYEVSSGVFTYLKLRVKARSDATRINTQMNLAGTKEGPEDSQISFNVDGVDSGQVTVIVLVDGKQVLYKTITIGSGDAPAQTTTVPTQTATTPAGSGGTPTPAITVLTPSATTPAPSLTAHVRTTGTTAPPAGTTSSGSVGPAIPAGLQTFYAADNKVTLTARGVEYAALLMVPAENLPADWVVISRAYTIAPDSLAFSPAATITFVIPPQPATADYAYFIGRYSGTTWSIVPSTAGAATVQAQISQAGTYALVAYRPESTLPVATTSLQTGSTTAPATPAVPAGTPKIASIAQAAATTAPASPATPAPWLPLDLVPVLGALAVVFFVTGRASR